MTKHLAVASIVLMKTGLAIGVTLHVQCVVGLVVKSMVVLVAGSLNVFVQRSSDLVVALTVVLLMSRSTVKLGM